MKIYLYLLDKILTFSIPKKVLGSFSFDENLEEESKLINIEARDGQWYLYSAGDTSIIINGGEESSVPLVANNYYVIRRNKDRDYLIYVSDLFDDSFLAYSYGDNLNITIGNNQSCNLQFSCDFLNGACAVASVRDHRVVLSKTNDDAIYINDVIDNFKDYYLKSGDFINIYGLKIMVLNGMLLINNPMNKVNLDTSRANLNVVSLVNSEEPQDIEVKDEELYTKEQYFSKSPRIRRTIKTKEIDLSPPPKQEGEEKMPLILTMGPMMTMGLVSLIMVVNTVSKIQTGEVSFKNAWPQLATSGAMLLSMIVWPSLTKMFNKKIRESTNKEIIDKYTAYLKEREKDLANEEHLQRDILIENLIPVQQCLPIIKTAKFNFWDKRIEQSDFLEVRIGMGNALLDVEVNYPEEGFTIDEDELRKRADALVEKYKYIKDVPIGYSFFKNKITAVMGINSKCYGLLNNIILQLITFYGYDDIKLVVFTNKNNEDKWEYIKYLNHSFSNDKSLRFFSTNNDSAKKICDYLNFEIQNRIQFASENEGVVQTKPYYILIADDYDSIKRHGFVKTMTEMDANMGFSLIILENSLNKLPSKCNNFINLSENVSSVLINSFEQQEQIQFKDEIDYGIDMMAIAKKLSNIPIEFQDGNKQLPDAITFLEMEKVGKVEQLNILNRWDMNDSTSSLKAEVGVDEEGNLMYLDLHEKFHGPHGLIAGTTGSGKSEFIITYILSMCVNYSPYEVSFILIDYKGGGLALAFENRTTGVVLPHLAGTITNLDKAEMDRTLVSIDSEIKRRQGLFNSARDKLGESTMDIYKYQRLFKEGKLDEPVPHLFIICDEFAELKSQQPDFMDNLISVARIGRSLGVHLILATQKPSGVVNDQIWSNTKFRVCLKVNDASDSKEMLKRPDAAALKQTGRFYLQVGYDEYFALGQSGWCGAKYYPSEKIIKQVDKSVNFIDDTGNFIKSIQAGGGIKIEPQGEQLSAIMASIIEVSKISNKKAKRLWLNNIDPIILINNLIQKYAIKSFAYNVEAIIGEYDAPEKQEQGLLTYSLKEKGNSLIFGNDELEREGLVSSIIYSSCILHKTEELNIYIIDYGSESLRMFESFPQVGGIVCMGEDEKFKNVFKLIMEEIKNRKKLLASYGGSLDSYNAKNESKLPQILFILNNYEAILEIYNDIYEDISSMGRDCSRYGVYFILTCNTPATIGRRVGQCFENRYALHLTDPSDYYNTFNMKCNVKPRDILGRGLAYNGGMHEFQTASIVDEEHSVMEFVGEVSKKLKEFNTKVAPAIPSLPDKVTFDIIEKEISTIQKVPIGISKNTLKVIKFDFSMFKATTITSGRIDKLDSFVDSLLDVFSKIPNLYTFFIDAVQLLPTAKEKANIKYYDDNFDMVLDSMIEFENNQNSNNQYNVIYVLFGLDKLKNKIESVSKLETLLGAIKKSENSNVIFLDSSKNLKALEFDSWYSQLKNNSDGIWIGDGFGEQQSFRLSKVTKEHTAKYPTNYGFCIKESDAELMKVLEFNDLIKEDDEDEE
ncbi:MAG: type VII secretion protein EssC [Bacilli bacterium]|nr:type VII secretion protein EssC [Bacilli bacterium]